MHEWALAEAILASATQIAEQENLTTISEDFLVTSEGKDYFRWEFTYTQLGKKVHQVVYFFESGDWTLIIAYTRLADQASEYDALVEESMKTVRYER